MVEWMVFDCLNRLIHSERLIDLDLLLMVVLHLVEQVERLLEMPLKSQVGCLVERDVIDLLNLRPLLEDLQRLPDPRLVRLDSIEQVLEEVQEVLDKLVE